MKRPVILLMARKRNLTQDLQKTLGQRGYEVIIPSRDTDPLQLFHETKPDLIITGSYRMGLVGAWRLPDDYANGAPKPR